jgi:hypothetical protein
VAAHHAARPPTRRQRDLSDDNPCRLVDAIRRSFSFPALYLFQFGIGKCRHDIIDEPPIRPSTMPAGPAPQSSAAFSSHQPAQNHPPPTPLPDQFPINGQLLAAVPQVRFSEAFGRRPSPLPGSTARAAPASETLTESGHHSR